MERYTNDRGIPCYRNAHKYSEFESGLFHKVEMTSDCGNRQWALHTDIGSLTVLDRMTGFGYRDVETGFRDMDGNFWLASGDIDVRYSGAQNLGDAIEWIKKRANNCIPKLSKESEQ